MSFISISSFAQSKEELAGLFKKRDWNTFIAGSTELLKNTPKDVELRYWRAIAFYYSGDTDKCLTDIGDVISIDSLYSPVYLFKAQLMYAKNKKDAACASLKKAISLGVEQARQFELDYCGSTSPMVNESLALDWPDDENWTLANRQSNKGVSMIELVHKGESLTNWSEIGTMMVMPKNGMKLTAHQGMEIFSNSAKQGNPNLNLTLIESEENTEYPWVIFKIENQKSSISDNYESQVYSIVIGRQNIFVSFRAIKEKIIPAETERKWVAFFKTGKIVNSEN